MIINKEILRTKYLNIRKNISNKEEVSKSTFSLVKELDVYKQSKVIALFSSMKDEIDTTFFALLCLKDHKKICYPKSFREGKMEFYYVDSLNDLIDVGPFKIKEPIENKEKLVNKKDIDLMIMPGIVFDYDRNRVGFGKGYYDRYLLGNFNIYKLGVTFDELIMKDDRISISDNDVKVDMILSLHNLIK